MFSGFGSAMFGATNFGPIATKFEDYFRCYPVAMMADSIRKDDANYGGKIFLPPSALNKLTMLHIRYPMLFQLENEASNKTTHSGVLEFVAEEGRAYLPQWMMVTLGISPGDILKISNCDLPLGSFVKIEPQSVDFLDISDPKAVLENVLRKFSTLTVDDMIEVNYNDSIYGIKILEVKPESSSHGICVVETDLETDFAPPVGYVEPEYTPLVTNPSGTQRKPINAELGAGFGTMGHSLKYADIVAESSKNESFKGQGQSLSGAREDKLPKKASINNLDPNAPPAPFDLPDNVLFFGFPVILPKAELENAPEIENAFTGTGQSLRQKKKRKDKSSSHPSLKNHSRSPDYIEID